MSAAILIIGAGAVGTYLGGTLALQGHQVIFLEREGDLPSLQQRGLKIHREDGVDQINSADFISSLSQITAHPLEWGVLALKSYHLKAIEPSLEKYRQDLPPLLCILNGVENERELELLLGSEKVIPATVTTAVQRHAKGDVQVEKDRGLGIALNHPLARQIAEGFCRAGIDTMLYSDPSAMKWSKLLTNLMANASSAVLGMTPGEIYRHPGLYRLEIQQLREALQVMEAMEVSPVNLPGIPVILLAWVVRKLPWQVSHPIVMRAVRRGRGGKMPSLFQDLDSGREHSEVDELNGAVVRAAERLQIPTPANRLLNRTLLRLIRGEESRAIYDHNPSALLSQL